VIAKAGAGRVLLNEEQVHGAIGEHVAAMLGPCPERLAAGRIRDEIAALPAPADVVPILETLA
jgi:UDP:flavonoid glycosyltransferase YjiC (YdhE family)